MIEPRDKHIVIDGKPRIIMSGEKPLLPGAA